MGKGGLSLTGSLGLLSALKQMQLLNAGKSTSVTPHFSTSTYLALLVILTNRNSDN